MKSKSKKNVRQTSLQLTAATERQVAELRALGFGSFTDIVRLAIDRMRNQEMQDMIRASHNASEKDPA